MLSNVKVLIVDDNSGIRMHLKKILGEFNPNSVSEAPNGKEALDYISSNSVDLVFLDLNMPVMSGEAFLDQVKKLNLNLYIVVISADSSRESIVGALSNGANNFIVKPVKSHNVKRAIDNFLAKRT